ncbi:MAG: hypothetical protein JWR63_1391 [Conexibacter sp.]|nr:hypothetical protein [Conexibacter sp.]
MVPESELPPSADRRTVFYVTTLLSVPPCARLHK